jgi:hypothetical protein
LVAKIRENQDKVLSIIATVGFMEVELVDDRVLISSQAIIVFEGQISV